MTTISNRDIGSDGLALSAVGLGCMGMSQHYGPTDDDQSIATINRALELGVTHLDTAVTYGDGHNEALIARAIAGRRDEVVLATKFGIVRGPGGPGVDGRPERARACCETSLSRLGTEHVDLFYLHRVDPEVPIEESVGAMAELVTEGKVRHLGLSEANAEALRRAGAVHAISALQAEWSLWSRDIEDEILPVARELGIGIVPYRPLGQGFLTGSISGRADLPAGDLRRGHERFEENSAATQVELTGADLAALGRLVPAGQRTAFAAYVSA